MTDVFNHALIEIHVEQNAACIAHRSPRPFRNHQCVDYPCKRVHPDPAKRASQQEADNRQNRNRGVGNDVNVGRADVVVTSCGRFCILVVVIVFLEFDLMFSVGQADYRTECVRLK